MKSYFLIASILFSLAVFAQNPGTARKAKPNFTPEQQAELQAKKLALTLDLTEKQTKELEALELERAKARKANRDQRANRRSSSERPTDEEIFAMRSKQLDDRTAHQKKMKKILTPEQFETWKEMGQNRQKNRSIKNKRNGNGTQKGNRPSKAKKNARWN